MAKYSPELKAKMLRQLLPPDKISIRELSEKEGIPCSTLYNWLNQKQSKGAPMTSNKSAESWSSEQKLAVVVETYSMNAGELNEYSRTKGIYPEQIKAWKESCLLGYLISSQTKKSERAKSKESRKRIRSLEKELHRKEKALAEAAALLTLGKKYDALWADKEEN
jgi:transposase-like protein